MHVYGYFLRLFIQCIFGIVGLFCQVSGLWSGRPLSSDPTLEVGRLEDWKLLHSCLPRLCIDARAQASEIGREASEIGREASEIGREASEIEFLRDREERVQRQKGFIISK